MVRWASNVTIRYFVHYEISATMKYRVLEIQSVQVTEILNASSLQVFSVRRCLKSEWC